MEAIPNRRDEILSAALECFLDKGYQLTTIAQIRAKSGASTGSIYHLFSGKPDIANALILQAIDDWSETPDQNTPSIKKSIKASVTSLLTRSLENPGLSQFMDEMRILANNDDSLTALKQTFDADQGDAKKLYRAAVKAGKVRDIPWPIANALMLGPTYAFLRNQNLPENDLLELIRGAAQRFCVERHRGLRATALNYLYLFHFSL